MRWTMVIEDEETTASNDVGIIYQNVTVTIDSEGPKNPDALSRILIQVAHAAVQVEAARVAREEGAGGSMLEEQRDGAGVLLAYQQKDY